MSERTISLVFIGCGQATRIHSRLLARLDPNVRRSYASRDGTKAEAFRREFGGERAYGSYADAIAGEHDVVLIATPPSSHLELATRALAAGRHVIVEKPAFPRAADVDEALRIAAGTGRQLMVAENYWYRPLLVRLRELIPSGVVGEVRFVHVNALKTQRTGGWRDEAAFAAGGALFEGGVHWVNFMANLGLTVRAVHGFRPGPAGGLDRSMLLVFEYASGTVGTLSYSWEIRSPLRGLRLSRVYGTEGSLSFESNGLFLAVDGKRKSAGLPGLRDLTGRKAMMRDFLQVLRAGGEPRFTAMMARRDLELMEQAGATLQEAGA